MKQRPKKKTQFAIENELRFVKRFMSSILKITNNPSVCFSKDVTFVNFIIFVTVFKLRDRSS